MLKSEKMSKAAILSFRGSAQRLWRVKDNIFWKLLALVLIPVAWIGVSLYYILWLFGGVIILLPFRLIFKARRHSKIKKQRHRETIGE